MIVAALRVKNEARWIRRVLASVAPVCHEAHVLDDNSTDGTADICRAAGATVHPSPWTKLNEARDKNYLLTKLRAIRADWVLWIDGDELLDPRSVPALLAVAEIPNVLCVSFRIRFLWNDETTERVDGVYGLFRRQSMFRPLPTATFIDHGNDDPNFHCGNCPRSLFHRCAYPEVSLLHLGYMDAADRIRKRQWYIEQHRKSGALRQLALEDEYRHITVGDECPADTKYKHGGPLQLARL